MSVVVKGMCSCNTAKFKSKQREAREKFPFKQQYSHEGEK